MPIAVELHPCVMQFGDHWIMVSFARKLSNAEARDVVEALREYLDHHVGRHFVGKGCRVRICPAGDLALLADDGTVTALGQWARPPRGEN